MPIVRSFQPSYATVGAYARAGAAGVAQRENTSRTADRVQQADQAQAHLNLQREGMYQTAVARLADSRNEAMQAAAALKARQDEATAGRDHAETMQQSGFDNASQLAKENDARAADLKKVQYDYEITRDGEVRNSQANQALSRVRQMHASGQLTDDDRNQAELAIEADRNSIEKMPVPRKKVVSLRHQIIGDDPNSEDTRGYVETDRGTWFMQPDGKKEFRPHKVPEVATAPKAMGDNDRLGFYDQTRRAMIAERATDAPLPTAQEVQAEMRVRWDAIQGIGPSVTSVPSAGAAPTGATQGVDPDAAEPFPPATSTVPQSASAASTVTPALRPTAQRAPTAQEITPAAVKGFLANAGSAAAGPLPSPTNDHERAAQKMFSDMSTSADRFAPLLPGLKDDVKTIQNGIARHGWSFDNWPETAKKQASASEEALVRIHSYVSEDERSALPPKPEAKSMLRGAVYGPVKAPNGKYYDMMWNGTKLVSVGEYETKAKK